VNPDAYRRRYIYGVKKARNRYLYAQFTVSMAAEHMKVGEARLRVVHRVVIC